MTGKFEVFKSKNKWYFHLKASNGQIIADSEAYNTKQGALKGIASVQRFAGIAKIQVEDSDEIYNKKQLVKSLINREKIYNDPNDDQSKPKGEEKDEFKVLNADDKPYKVKNLKRMTSWL